MNRMTEVMRSKHYENGAWFMGINVEDDGYNLHLIHTGANDTPFNANVIAGPIVNRLSRYESLGMEPEEISEKLIEQFRLLEEQKKQIASKDSQILNLLQDKHILEKKNEHQDELHTRIHEIAEERDDYKKGYSEKVAELDRAFIATRSLNKTIAEMENKIRRYEVMKQTLEMIYGVNIDI